MAKREGSTFQIGVSAAAVAVDYRENGFELLRRVAEELQDVAKRYGFDRMVAG